MEIERRAEIKKKRKDFFCFQNRLIEPLGKNFEYYQRKSTSYLLMAYLRGDV